MLMNLDTGMIVHEKNPDEKLAPGPLVNIMTAIIVLENCDSLSKELTLDPDIYTPIYTSSADSSDIPLGIDLNDNDVLTRVNPQPSYFGLGNPLIKNRRFLLPKGSR